MNIQQGLGDGSWQPGIPNLLQCLRQMWDTRLLFRSLFSIRELAPPPITSWPKLSLP